MARPRILIADDDEIIQLTLATILRSKGFEAEGASSGAEAKEKISSSHFDAVIIDIRLGDLEGTELLPFIKKNNPQTVKIIVTGFADVENSIRAVNYGADAYLRKPIKPEELLSTIKDRLEQKEQNAYVTEDRVSSWIENRFKQLKAEHEQEQNSLNKKPDQNK